MQPGRRRPGLRDVAGLNLSDIQVGLARRRLGDRIDAGTAQIVTGAIVESGLVGLVGTVVGIASGFAALVGLVYGLLPSSLPDFALTPAISPETMVVAVIVGIGVVGLAPSLTWRRRPAWTFRPRCEWWSEAGAIPGCLSGRQAQETER